MRTKIVPRAFAIFIGIVLVAHGGFGVLSASAAPPPAPAAAPQLDNSGCPPSGESGWTKVESSSLSGYPVAGADDYCFKAGPYVVDSVPEGGFGQEGACTEDHVERCGLSHWAYHMGPTNTPVPPTSTPVPPTPTNTPVPPTPTEGPSPTPTMTSTPGGPTETPDPTATPKPHHEDKEPPATAATIPYLPVGGATAEILFGLAFIGAAAWKRE